MNKRIRFSIIIPIYNAEHYLRQSLDSICQQTFHNIEIICINDGSTDDSQAILEEYAARDQRIKVYTEVNHGAFTTRRIGALIAQGEYLLFVDADDWLSTDACETIDTELQKHNCDILQFANILEGDLSAFSPEDQKWIKEFFSRLCSVTIGGSKEIINSCFAREKLMWHYWGKAIRLDVAKQSFAAMPEVRCNFAEDQIAMCYIFSCANTLVSIENRLYHYRLGTGISTQSKENLRDLENKLTCFTLYHELKTFMTVKYKDNYKDIETSMNWLHNSMMENMWYRIIHNACKSDFSKWMAMWCKYATGDEVSFFLVSKIIMPEAFKEMEEETVSSGQLGKDGVQEVISSHERLSRKNRKHLRVIRILIVISVLLLISNILMILFS